MSLYIEIGSETESKVAGSREFQSATPESVHQDSDLEQKVLGPSEPPSERIAQVRGLRNAPVMAIDEGQFQAELAKMDMDLERSVAEEGLEEYLALCPSY